MVKIRIIKNINTWKKYCPPDQIEQERPSLSTQRTETQKLKQYNYGPLNVEKQKTFKTIDSRDELEKTSEEAARMIFLSKATVLDKSSSPRMKGVCCLAFDERRRAWLTSWMHHFKCHIKKVLEHLKAKGKEQTDKKIDNGKREKLKKV